MSISINGIAHLQMNVFPPRRKALEFWERLCHFLEMELLQGEDSRYFRQTGILVRELIAPMRIRRLTRTKSTAPPLFRARSREDVDQVYAFISNEPKAHIVRAPRSKTTTQRGIIYPFEDPGVFE